MELTRPFPHFSASSPSVAQRTGIAAPPLFFDGVPRMMNRTPFHDPSRDPDLPPDEPRHPDLLATRPKATFQWPPDCLWPFIDQKFADQA